MSISPDSRELIEQDLLALAQTFASMKRYRTPTSMRYTLFVQKDGTVGDEVFAFYEKEAAPTGIHLARLRELKVVGLCVVTVLSESDRYYGLHLTITDPRFEPRSYYLPKALRLMKDEAGQPDYGNIQALSASIT